MKYILQKDKVKIRLMEDEIEEYKFMTKWLSTPEVLDFYEGRSKSYSLEAIIKKFGPRAKGEEVVPCMIEYDGVTIGYVQYYETNARDYEISNILFDEKISKIMAMDIVIGETNFWNRGIGTEVMREIISYLFSQKGADMIWIDPIVSNERAIRWYEKSGFKKLAIVPNREMHDGEYKDSCIMYVKQVVR